MKPVDHRPWYSSFRRRHWLTVSAIVLAWSVMLVLTIMDGLGLTPPW